MQVNSMTRKEVARGLSCGIDRVAPGRANQREILIDKRAPI